MRKNVTIYPYDAAFTPMIRSCKFTEIYNIVAISSLMGWGLCNKDAGYADGGNSLDLMVDNKFEEHFEQSEAVIFINPEHQIDLNKFIYPKMISAIDNGKNIICLLQMNDKLFQIEEYATSKGIIFEKIKSKDYVLDFQTQRVMFNNNVPVIFIMGMSENTNKFELQLQIKDQFDALGYKAVLIGSKSYCEMIDCISFPSFMFANDLSETDKIYKFNNFVKNVEVENKPDLIIIGIPGGIGPYNKVITNNFGVSAFEVSQAITPDFVIMSLYCNLFTREYFDNLEKLAKYRYGFEINMFNIANKKIDFNEMQYANDYIHTFTLNLDYINQHIKNIDDLSDKVFCNIMDDNGAKEIVQHIVNDLVKCDTGIVF